MRRIVVFVAIYRFVAISVAGDGSWFEHHEPWPTQGLRIVTLSCNCSRYGLAYLQSIQLREPEELVVALNRSTRRRWSAFAALSAVALVALASSSIATAAARSRRSHRRAPAGRQISVVAAENEYGNVAAQIGGRYVRVTSIEDNPDVDPHSYELSPSLASMIEKASVVIQNGLGYDTFMNRIEAAAPNRERKVISAQQLLGVANSTPNPHLWYQPATMPAIARALAHDLSSIDPAQARYFAANVRAFDTSLGPWRSAISAFEHSAHATTAATTEPVADYLLQAMGVDNLTPLRMQLDIMNGTDPSPQDITDQYRLLSGHRVRVFVYNAQVVDPLTMSFRSAARKAHIPVVAVYETMPTPGFDYQRWMLAETNSLARAIEHGVSTLRL